MMDNVQNFQHEYDHTPLSESLKLNYINQMIFFSITECCSIALVTD